MKAAVYERYGPPEVVELREVATPTPKDHEILIKTRVATVTSGDYRARTLDVPPGFGFLMRPIFGIVKPRQPILGSELAGTVESVGHSVRDFKVGDPIFAFSDAMGCHAEYRCLSEKGALARKPANLTYEEGAALSFGGTTALHFLRKAKLKSGERILVNGASGSVGTACVQLARHFGAEVTGVCSGPNLELVKSLGAQHVIDYTREDFARNERAYDVIVDTVGNAPFSRSKRALNDGGRLLLVFATLSQMIGSSWASVRSTKKVIPGVALGRREDLRYLAQLAEEGAFRPIIDLRFPFEKIVEAHRYVDTGRKRGNVVITFSP